MPDQPDHVLIQADKIVDGKPVTMGVGPWRYDRDRNTLEFRTERQVWLLRIEGLRIDGTLTMGDGTVFRKMTLRKDD